MNIFGNTVQNTQGDPITFSGEELKFNCPRDKVQLNTKYRNEPDEYGNIVTMYYCDCPTCEREWKIPGTDLQVSAKYRI